MRYLLLFFAAALTALFTVEPATAQDRALASQCHFEGTWHAQAGFTTRIDAQRRWSTWSGNSTNGSPGAHGWVLTDAEFMTFDYEGAEDGYAYVWSFEDECAVLDLRLVRRGERPDESGIHIRFNRVR